MPTGLSRSMLIRLSGAEMAAVPLAGGDFSIGSSRQIFFRRDAMTIYISRGRCTSDAVKGMVAKPENREEAVSKLCESVGGKLIGWYLTFGHHDWLCMAEFPDDRAAASAILA